MAGVKEEPKMEMMGQTRGVLTPGYLRESSTH